VHIVSGLTSCGGSRASLAYFLLIPSLGHAHQAKPRAGARPDSNPAGCLRVWERKRCYDVPHRYHAPKATGSRATVHGRSRVTIGLTGMGKAPER
jgi:hypothetical protein